MGDRFRGCLGDELVSCLCIYRVRKRGRHLDHEQALVHREHRIDERDHGLVQPPGSEPFEREVEAMTELAATPSDGQEVLADRREVVVLAERRQIEAASASERLRKHRIGCLLRGAERVALRVQSEHNFERVERDAPLRGGDTLDSGLDRRTLFVADRGGRDSDH